MTLAEFKARQGLTFDQLATVIGASRSACLSWVYGRRTPRYCTMLSIEETTEGHVTVRDWVHTVAGG